MKKNGFTLLELLICISLISVVMIFLFRLINDVQNEGLSNTYIVDNQTNRNEIISILNKKVVANGKVCSITLERGLSTNAEIKFCNNNILNITVSSSSIHISDEEDEYNYVMDDDNAYYDPNMTIKKIVYNDNEYVKISIITDKKGLRSTSIDDIEIMAQGNDVQIFSYELKENADFEYTGEIEKFKVITSGTYYIQAWGAQGGSYTYQNINFDGGLGGYASGYMTLKRGDVLYVAVGGAGKIRDGGFNGGAYGGGYNSWNYGGGGGATDIRLNNTDINSRILVAGGGGGASYYSAGTAGGLPSTINNNQFFNGVQSTDGGSGGGGYYGGNAGTKDNGGSGGTSFISDDNLYPAITNKVFTNVVMKTGLEEMPSHNSIVTMVGNAGDGYASIKLIAPIVDDTSLENLDLKYHIYPYSGHSEKFIASKDGKYKIEAWGASGGYNENISGRGSYTSGIISLNKDDILYLNVGQATDLSATYNGGAACSSNCSSGGGASDVRYFSNYTPSNADLSWNSEIGLNSRIMVAAGGGGYNPYSAGYKGGKGGDLVGYSGEGDSPTTAASQIAGGVSYGNVAVKNGYFGQGGSGDSWGGGGGSGYYGGAGGNNSSTGNGGGSGSSYISGHLGCIAIKSENNR
ncbi:MAG: prepilin-type N-terminal cleavage/methylation domain-containing protein, partial [Bacilli bacterium]|nr:prepilin-type N-terminal cleavage/methylation domain-containing protein [Bacilli bacterium]